MFSMLSYQLCVRLNFSFGTSDTVCVDYLQRNVRGKANYLKGSVLQPFETACVLGCGFHIIIMRSTTLSAIKICEKGKPRKGIFL